MIKSWADCSSDEDTDDNYSVESEEQVEEQTIDAAFSEKVQVDGQGPNEGGPEQQVRTYDFPDRAPFTAFVGNLSYDIQESSQLQQALADVVFERLGERINVLGGRISYDRDSKNRQHRGFGYVELETLEELKMVMKLNDDGQALLAGRKIQVDTANHQNQSNNNFNRRGQQGSNHHDNPRGSFNRRNDARPQNNEPFEKIDGSKFRGGKFNNNDKNSNSNSNSNSNNNNSFRNNSSSSSSNNSSNNNNNNNNNNSFRNNSSNNNSSIRNNSFQNGPASGDAPRQRPSLKLAPRSKPVDEGKNAVSSNIFGGAKARDEQTWKKSRQQQQPASGGDETKKTTVSSKKGGEDNSSSSSNINNNNNKTTGKDKKTEPQDRRPSGRGGGRGGKGRGNNRGGNNTSGRGDQKDKRGSGKKQHDKKLDKKQQQSSPEEKAAAAAAAKTNNKNTDTPPPNPEPKAPKAPKNRFALLNDSDSD